MTCTCHYYSNCCASIQIHRDTKFLLIGRATLASIRIMMRIVQIVLGDTHHYFFGIGSVHPQNGKGNGITERKALLGETTHVVVPVSIDYLIA